VIKQALSLKIKAISAIPEPNHSDLWYSTICLIRHRLIRQFAQFVEFLSFVYISVRLIRHRLIRHRFLFLRSVLFV